MCIIFKTIQLISTRKYAIDGCQAYELWIYVCHDIQGKPRLYTRRGFASFAVMEQMSMRCQVFQCLNKHISNV